MDLKKFRLNNALTQRELAHKMGTNRVTIIRWEKGKVTPRLKTMIQLAKLFNCTIDELINP